MPNEKFGRRWKDSNPTTWMLKRRDFDRLTTAGQRSNSHRMCHCNVNWPVIPCEWVWISPNRFCFEHFPASMATNIWIPFPGYFSNPIMVSRIDKNTLWAKHLSLNGVVDFFRIINAFYVWIHWLSANLQNIQLKRSNGSYCNIFQN